MAVSGVDVSVVLLGVDPDAGADDDAVVARGHAALDACGLLRPEPPEALFELAALGQAGLLGVGSSNCRVGAD